MYPGMGFSLTLFRILLGLFNPRSFFLILGNQSIISSNISLLLLSFLSFLPKCWYFKVFPIFIYLFFKDFILILRERGKEGERGRETSMWKRYIYWLSLTHPQLGTWPATQACALSGNWTSDLLVHRSALNPLNQTSQGWRFFCLFVFLIYSHLFNNPNDYSLFVHSTNTKQTKVQKALVIWQNDKARIWILLSPKLRFPKVTHHTQILSGMSPLRSIIKYPNLSQLHLLTCSQITLNT